MRRPNFLGLAVGSLFFATAASPSLLPRYWVFQAVIAGISTACGYGLGTFLSYLGRRLPFGEPSKAVRRFAWQALAIVAPAGIFTMWLLGVGWQFELHDLVGLAQPSPWGYALALLLGLAITVVLVLIGRGLLAIYRRLGNALSRWLPKPIASLSGGLLVALVLIGVWDGVLSGAFFSAADETFRLSDALIDDGVPQPDTDLRSGGPGSAVKWEDLGSKGRAFTSHGPTTDELEEFSGLPALEPIRVYAGLASGEDVAERAALVVAELERTGAFDRSVLCVVTTTGTGWVDPLAAEALEYIWNGDTAIAALQYSYLPSWLSYIVDSVRSREAGTVFFDTIHRRWEELPPDRRPRLVVFGESLGVDGSGAAFSGDADIRNRTDGALWVGPPNFSQLWAAFTREREAGTPERLPVYDGGRTVRFAGEQGDIDPDDPTWEYPRALYLQHASDPVVWASPRLLLRQPDWMREPPGPGVLPQMRWYPLITFSQVTADLSYAHLLPPGHGHNYGGLVADGWAAIGHPSHWTRQDTERLHQLLDDEARAAIAAAG